MDRILNYIFGGLIAILVILLVGQSIKYNALQGDFNRINNAFNRLNTSFNQVLAQAEAQKMDIQEIQVQNRQDYEALEKSCKAQIKQAVETTLKAKPICKTGVALYDLKGVVK